MKTENYNIYFTVNHTKGDKVLVSWEDIFMFVVTRSEFYFKNIFCIKGFQKCNK